ncbi:MAG: acyltransferase family protein [Micrococcales bacterium]
MSALRSVLLLMGVMGHAAMVLPLFDPRASATDVLLLKASYQLVHIWRVPTYFLVSGFLSAALFARGTIWDFVRGRFKRVTSVLLAAQLFIIPVFALSPGGCAVCQPFGGSTWLAVGWLHLWFLYDLVIISHLFVAAIWLKRRLPAGVQAWIYSAASRFTIGPFSLLALATLCTLIPGVFGPGHLLRINFGILPDPWLILYHSIFFSSGWLLRRNGGLVNPPRYLWLTVGAAIALTLVTYSSMVANGVAETFLSNLTSWVSAWAVIGCFTRLVTKPNRLWTYLNDASYWVYLWHAIPVLLLSWSFAHLGLNVWLNLFATSAITLALTLVSYNRWVAPTVIGLYLSGRRRTKIHLSGSLESRTQAIPTGGPLTE